MYKKSKIFFKKSVDEKIKRAHTILIHSGNRVDEIRITIVIHISNLGKSIGARTKLIRRFSRSNPLRLTIALVEQFLGIVQGLSSLLEWLLS